MPKLSNYEAWESATAVVSDLENIQEELETISSQSKSRIKVDIDEAIAHVRFAITKLMDMEQ